MARASKSADIDLSRRHDLTAGLIERLRCPAGKPQAFLRDTEAPALRVRVTAHGAKSFVFEGKLNRQTIRRTIGDVRDWSIDAARAEARRLAVMLDGGTDPREVERQKGEAAAAAAATAVARSLTVGAVWPKYLKSGKPKRRDAWKPRYRLDLERMGSAGGEAKKRGEGRTRPGPLYPLMALPLASVNEETLVAWYQREAEAGKHQATRALMMFRGFLRWCAARPEYRRLTDRDAGKAPAILDALPSSKKRTDALEAAQVPDWWAAVEQLNNRTASAYLRALLLTGARREELASLTWAKVDMRWKKLTIADKVEATRTIPLTPYLRQMLASLPRTNAYVFASVGQTGRIADVRSSHAKALREAGIEGLTIHGLRRSFSLLGEAAGAPAGAIAQVMGHKPSGTADLVDWSSNAANFKSEQDVRASFRTIKADGGTTEKALFRAALDSGWQDPDREPGRVSVSPVQARTAAKGPHRPPKPPQAAEYVTSEVAPGKSIGATLCFTAHKADDGRMLVPYETRTDDVRLPDGTIIQNVPTTLSRQELVAKLKANGFDVSKYEFDVSKLNTVGGQPGEPQRVRYWRMNDAYSSDVSAYTRGVADKFALTPEGRNKAEQRLSKARLEQWKQALQVLLGGLAVGWVLTTGIGWIARGFMGVPRGQDRRPAHPTGRQEAA